MGVFSNISVKEKMGLAAAGLIVFFAVADRLVISPISGKFKRINSEIRVHQRQLSQSLRNISHKDEIAGEYQKYLQYVKSNYSEGEEVAKLLEEIELLGHNSGISINDIKPQPPRRSGIYKYYLIEIQADGRMDTLINFMYQLSASKNLFRVSRIYVGVKDKEASIAKVSMLVTKVVVT